MITSYLSSYYRYKAIEPKVLSVYRMTLAEMREEIKDPMRVECRYVLMHLGRLAGMTCKQASEVVTGKTEHTRSVEASTKVRQYCHYDSAFSRLVAEFERDMKSEQLMIIK